MAVVYEQAEPEVHQMAREILEQYHPELRLPDGTHPTIAILMASVGADSDDYPLKDGPYRVLGKIKAVPYVQRVDGRRDAELLLDAGHWNGLTDRRQRALLDHFITCLEFNTGADSCVKTDEFGRPKLRERACDWYLKGFGSIAARYGEDAPEVVAAQAFQKQYGKVAMPGDKLFA
jgi:hypothetical protein